MRKETTYFTVVAILICPSLPACVRRVAKHEINYYRATIKVPETPHIRSLPVLSEVPGFRRTPLEQREATLLHIWPTSAPHRLFSGYYVTNSQLWDCGCFSSPA